MTNFFLTVYISPLSSIRGWIAILVISWCVLSLVFSQIRSIRIAWSIMNSVACVVGLFLIIWITVLRRSPGQRIIYAIPFYAFYLAKRQPEMYREMLMNLFLFVPVGLTLPYAMEMSSDLLAKYRKQERNKANKQDANKKKTRMMVKTKAVSHGSRYVDKKVDKESSGRKSIVNSFTALEGGRLFGRLKIIGYCVLFAAVFSFSIELFQALFALGTAEVDDVIMNTLGTAIGCCPFLVRLKGIKDL